MSNKKFTVTNKVWLWPTEHAAWHFIYVDGKVKDKIRKVAKPHHMGMVRVEVTIGTTSWTTSLFPHKREDCYLLSLKKTVRQSEGIFEGDTVTATLKLM